MGEGEGESKMVVKHSFINFETELLSLNIL